MAKNIINRLNSVVIQLENALDYLFGSRFPPGALFALDVPNKRNLPTISTYKSLKDILTEGFLWGVPKRRRPIEKRWCRRFGDPERVWKPIVLRNNIIMCPTCGHDFLPGHLCPNCYNRVKTETKELQKTVINNLGLEPIEKEVIVLYEGESSAVSKDSEFWKGQRIVEMPKKRPAWFHSNLLQPSTQETSDSTEVKPTELA